MGNRAVLARTVRHALVLLHLREVALLALEVRVGRGQLRAAAAVPLVVMVVRLLLLMLLFVQLLLLVTPGLVVVVPGRGGGGRGHGRRGWRWQRGGRRGRRLSLTGDAAVHDDHECGRGGRKGLYADSMIMVWLFSAGAKQRCVGVVALPTGPDLLARFGARVDDQDADLDTIDEMSGLDGSDLEETGGDI